jgi:hypothetical protein
MDALSMFRVEINIADHGNVRAEPCDASYPNPQCVPGVDGHFYSSYGILPSALGAPIYLAAKALGRVTPVPASVAGGFLTMQLTELVAAAVPVAVAWWIELMGYSWGASCFASLAFAFGSPFWFHGVKQFFSEPYMALPLILSAILALHGKNWRWFAAAGVMLGIAASARVVAVLELPVLLGVLGWRQLRSRRAWGDMIVFLASAGLLFLLIGIYNFTRFGSFSKSGYHWSDPDAAILFGVPLFKGFWSFLFEPDNSLLFFAPLILLTPWGLVLLFRKNRLDAVFCAVAFLLNILFFSKFRYGHAPWSYGPRYLMPVLALLFVPLAAVWDRIAEGMKWQRVAVTALLAMSIAMHVAGTIYPLPLYYWKVNWIAARTGINEPPGYIRSMFAGLPGVIGEAVQAQKSHPVADPLSEGWPQTLGAFPSFESFVQSLGNPFNVLGPDLWLVKFAIIMRIPWLCAGVAFLLLAAGSWFLAKGLQSAAP